MRFEDEQYVRLYKRDTTTWLMLNWQGRCILPLIFRKLDRAGLLDLGEDGLDALAAHIQVPLEIVEEGMKSILRRKALILREDGLLIAPRFIEAQEAKQSDKARQKAARDKARDLASAAVKGLLPPATVITQRDDQAAAPSSPPSDLPSEGLPRSVTPCDGAVTQRDASVAPRDETVTRGHTASQPVTLNCAQPSCAQPSPGGGAPVGVSSERTPPSPRPEGVPKGVFAMNRALFVDAYVAAVRAATGVPQWTMPPFGPRDLETLLTNWCTGKDRGDPEAWIARTVKAFVESNPTGHEPSRVIRFLNDQAVAASRPATQVTGAGVAPVRVRRPRTLPVFE